ncbi:MAG: MFS transporter, partial [Alcaligenaceae bacterium]
MTINVSEMRLANKRWTYMIPIVMVMYLLAYLDRGNVALILPFIGKDLEMSSSAKGFASGVFFLGYILLQIPSVLMARKWGARTVVAWLLIGWSVAATACGAVQNEVQLYLARFLLGVFEGGVLPVVILLLSRWFVESERSRANTLFLTCIPLSAVLAPPFTGWLLTVTSWRSAFFIEGITPLIWIIPWLLIVREHPTEARWLASSEAAQVQRLLDAEQREKAVVHRSGYRDVLRSRTVWQLIGIYTLWFAGAYGVILWLPTVIKNASPDSSALHVGALSAIPYAFALACMLVVSRYADRAVSVRMLVAAPLVIAAGATVFGQTTNNGVLQIALLAVVAAGSYMSLGVYLAVPTNLFPEGFAGVTVATMSTFGSVGGFAGPFAVGWLTDMTGSTSAGFLALATCFVISG